MNDNQKDFIFYHLVCFLFLIILVSVLFTGCGVKRTVTPDTIIINHDIAQDKLNGLQDRLDALELESDDQAAAISLINEQLTGLMIDLTSLNSQVDALDSNQLTGFNELNLQLAAITANISTMTGLINGLTANQVTVVWPCGNTGNHREILIKQGNMVWGYFTSGSSALVARLTVLEVGVTYMSTVDGVSCNFKISNNGTVTKL